MVGDGLYCDGGCIGRNPSRLGGTYAWCLVQGGVIVQSESGRANNHEAPATTNNYTELLAALQALSYMPEGWQGTIHTDSLITLRRIRSGTGFAGIPAWMRKDAIRMRTGRKWKSVLVAGHPTKAELKQGYRQKKNGRRYPVSKWNVWCDNECKRLAREFMENRK